MTVSLSSLAGAGWQFFDDNGDPLTGGKLYTYVAGTTTPAVTYTDSSGSIPNPNPIILDAAGRISNEVWLNLASTYKFVLTTSTDVRLWVKDNIPGILADSTLSGPGGAALIGVSGGGTVQSALDAKVDLTVLASDSGASLVGTSDGVTVQSALDSATLSTAEIGRGRVNYYSITAVEVIVPPNIVMGGFRFMGSYKKARAPLFASGVPYRAIVDFAANLGAETAANPDNWYAVFACANDGDATVQYKLMPFLRVGSVAGSSCALSTCEENTFAAAPVTYSWNGGDDNLAGVDCLVINEGSNNRFSGRVTKITANTATSVTLETVGSVSSLGYLLPAPPNFDHYCYLCTFYLETSTGPLGVEARNIADSGTIVMARNGNNGDPNWISSGAVAGPPGNKLIWASQISPLATGVCFSPTVSASTASAGVINTVFLHDGGNHDVARITMYKSTEAATVTQNFNVIVTFSIGQFMYYYVSGSNSGARVASFLLNTGWIEI